MRRCSECEGVTEPGHVTHTYSREGCDVAVTVAGIPAEVCQSCGEWYADINTLAEVEGMVAPLFAHACHPHRLPAARVTIELEAREAIAA